ncbi:Calcitonin gene-related peptide 2 [Manis javanica]|nr:Calcitonin gene-related peptide 2 [Manis javanica]
MPLKAWSPDANRATATTASALVHLPSAARAALESRSNAATSSEDESCHLLAALVKDYVRMKAQELGQETEGSSFSVAFFVAVDVWRKRPAGQQRNTQEESSNIEGGILCPL